MTDPAPEYVDARRVLLDALEALEGHHDNLILVGAQAVYHHTGDADLNVPLMTTDADLALDTRDLADLPEIGQALRTAGFTAGANPGHWVSVSDVAVDLMVVPHQSGTTKASARAARLAAHETATARIAQGLEPALVDHERITITALEAGDPRQFELRVAGPAALLTAKAIKIAERLAQADTKPDRVKEKDALDAFRLLRAVDTEVLVQGFAAHNADKHAAGATTEAIKIYTAHAGTADGRIAQLAELAALGDRTVGPAMAALVVELLAALDLAALN